MTTYRLNLTGDEGDTAPGRILASLVTEDAAVMAATLRAAAIRLDPPEAVSPATRGAYSWDTPEVRAALRAGGVHVDRRGDGGVQFAMNSGYPADPDADRRAVERDEARAAARVRFGWLQDGDDSNPGSATVNGPGEPGGVTPAVADAVRGVSRDVLDRARAMEPVRSTRIATITPDGCGPEHTFTGACAHADPT